MARSSRISFPHRLEADMLITHTYRVSSRLVKGRGPGALARTFTDLLGRRHCSEQPLCVCVADSLRSETGFLRE